MTDKEKIAVYEAIIGDLLTHPQDFHFIMDGLREGYPILAQQLVDKYVVS